MAWEYLQKGQSVPAALASLDHILNQVSSLAGSLNSDATLAANSYMAWAESTEDSLRSLYDDQAVSRRLHTARYWQIREISSATQRPQPLIRGEIHDQERSIQLLREQLLHYRDLLKPAADERLLVCDTNVFIHGRPFHQLLWNEQFEEKKVCLTIPLTIVDELDSLKDRGVRAAGGVLKDLDGFLSSDSALERVTLRANVTLQIVDEPVGHQRLSSNDDEIVRQMNFFASLCDSRVTLVTRDRGMRVRAHAAGLDARYLPPDYERRVNPEENNG
ncbi:PIN domain-containing protein [Arthrobacter sp. ERGS1:01]|uniref:PIN domain-containing protein n=1 Tax=Arthrobacter sp. ERGS1:01 TaxID=1704044 RepID=UPI0009E7EE43|nr:PIN domain-containing protein [Arthrobacter sp. ERGS1:01]